MKTIVKKTASAALAVVLLLCLLVVPAYADGENAAAAEKWNIMLVVDGSASLSSGQTTDPDGLRFEAIGSFLATLNAESADVGAIIFTSNDTDDSSDEAMQRGIKLNTGVLSMEDSSARQYLLNAMMNVKRDDRNRGQTDIGTALLCAQETLSALGNGCRSAIFLFTDGLTDVDGADVYNKSMENMETAINHIREENMLLCGVYLNKDGKQTSGEVRNIVMNANNISDSSLSLGDLYVEITDAQSCMDSTDHFLRALGYGITDDEDDEIIYESIDRTIRIPGVGVEEANIRLRTLDGQPLPKGMDVIFTQPDGTVISGAAASAICSTGSSYRVYKLTKPMSGTWKIHIELPEGNELGIKYNPIFSVNVGAMMETSPSASDLHSNMDVEVTGQMTQGGNALTAREAYQEYSCILSLTNAYTGEIREYEIVQNGNGSFTKLIHLDDYNTYDVSLAFICDKISVRAPSTTWILENRAPTVNDLVIRAPYGLLQKQYKEVDLKDRATDLEDGDNLTYSISGGTCDLSGVSISADTLSVSGKVCGTGSVVIDVADSQGAISQMTIHVNAKNMTVPMILILLAILIAIGVAALLVVRHINGMVPSGYCTVDFQMADQNDKFISVSLKPDAPGTGRVGRKTTLYDIIMSELNQSTVIGINPKNLSTVKSFIETEASKDLKAVSVKCVSGRVDKGNFNGKKVSVVQLAVRWDGQTNILYGNALTIKAGPTNFDFGYYDDYGDDDENEF